VVSSSINEEWIGQSITDETISGVLDGNIVTVQGRLGGMFSENMMTVGYPIKSNGNIYGGIFVCSPVPEIQETSSLVEEITASSFEQKSGADQVNEALSQLNLVIQQNAASAEEMSSTSEELANQAEELRQLVKFFKTDTGDATLEK